VKKLKSRIRLFLRYIDTFGLKGIIMFVEIVFGLSEKISIPDIKHPIIIRKDTTDKYVFRQIFIEKEYDIEFEDQPKLIIDAGANTGLASIFFANKYPEAIIIAIEPEYSNFKVLEGNTRKYKNIFCIQRALSNTADQSMEIVSEGLGEWGFITREIDSNTEENKKVVQSITVNEIFEKYDFNAIDIFKIDIEGAEKELFQNNYEEWLSITKNIIIEFHDRMKAGCRETFTNAIDKYDFSYFTKGENYIFVNNKTV